MDFTYNDYIKYFCNDGFLIPRLVVERPLYRYRGNIANAVNEIENDHIYMAPLDELNDPFDSSYAISFDEACQLTKRIMHFYLESYFLDGDPWHKELDSHIRSLPDEPITLLNFSKIVSDFAKQHGVNVQPQTICKVYYLRCFSKPPHKNRLGRVASFSETWESIPMWSYYANSHKGLCLKYDFSLLDKNDITHKNIHSSLQKVWYSEQRFIDSDNQFTPFMKALQWAHEQEWRLFRESDEKYLSLPCLTEIYLGIDVNSSDMDYIINAVRKNGRDIKMFLLHPKPDVFGFERIPLRY